MMELNFVGRLWLKRKGIPNELSTLGWEVAKKKAQTENKTTLFLASDRSPLA